jgi:Pyruvate/2-oxoacid:ferredoxin oxidoreductase delta subunit
MKFSKKDIDSFQKNFDIPAFMTPWLDRFFEDSEIELVLHLADKPLTITEIAEKWTSDEIYSHPNKLQDFLDRCYKRGIINTCDNDRFQPADFHARFDIWAMFEGWLDLPDEIREQLNAWELEYYKKQHRDQINTLKKGEHRDPAQTWPEYLLLHEAEALVEKVEHIYLWPCNCRSMIGRCTKNVYTCIRFSNNRNIGWEISKSRAKKIIREANKAGLMQNGELSVAADGTISGAICNCCADCCFPHQLAEKENASKLWPLTRYKASHLVDRCTACGRCVKRCPFQAFLIDKTKSAASSEVASDKKHNKKVAFDKSLCRGCGVCSTGCPEGAIEMVRLDHELCNSTAQQLLNE